VQVVSVPGRLVCIDNLVGFTLLEKMIVHDVGVCQLLGRGGVVAVEEGAGSLAERMEHHFCIRPRKKKENADTGSRCVKLATGILRRRQYWSFSLSFLQPLSSRPNQ
jgi:hypothetical protein